MPQTAPCPPLSHTCVWMSQRPHGIAAPHKSSAARSAPLEPRPSLSCGIPPQRSQSQGPSTRRRPSSTSHRLRVPHGGLCSSTQSQCGHAPDTGLISCLSAAAAHTPPPPCAARPWFSTALAQHGLGSARPWLSTASASHRRCWNCNFCGPDCTPPPPFVVATPLSKLQRV